MSHRGTESDFELATIDRLEAMDYVWQFGMDIERPHEQVVLPEVLAANLKERYPDLPPQAITDAVAKITRPDGVDTLRRNRAFHQLLTRGFELLVQLPVGKREHRHIYPVDWEDPTANDFRVVNQFPIKGPQNDRRPDVLIFINGLPLVLFELKNPYDEQPTVDDAFNQVQHYRNEIPQLFDYNGLVIVSDGVHTLHGMWPADMEWYAPWKTIDGTHIENNTTHSMKMLIEGLFPKQRLLEYLRDFVFFEDVNDRLAKKGAKYHQYFAVKTAVDKTLAAFAGQGDTRIGVIWHTTGSGKSLSMIFLVGILRRHAELRNPTFVLQVDRTDLDDQLHDHFVAARGLVGDVKHAQSISDLRDLLKTEGGEVIFTTIEKFQLKEGELAHPRLSDRSNIIVVADEAHRTQYGFTEGYARWLDEALPHAKRLGFTGTPISFHGADTVEVFGDLIHTYDMKQSQADKATVPIYYEPRQIKLHLNKKDVDAAAKGLEGQFTPAAIEKRKLKWAALAGAARAKERVESLAADLLTHFTDRCKTLVGKGMIVCMERANCVRLYEELKALPGCPETAIVMTGNLGEDPKEWSEKGYLTTKVQRDQIKKRMVDPADPLKLVVVCDMWLTGTDIPCLHTLYLDKPMSGHNMIQAISRVNRVFRDKPAGLIVDYIGIGDELREATANYTKGGGKGEPARSVAEDAWPVFVDCMAEIRRLMPAGKDCGNWRKMSRVEVEDLYAHVYGTLADDLPRLEEFRGAEYRLSCAHLLVKHLERCRPCTDEVIFYQRVRKQFDKATPGTKRQHDLESAMRDIVDDAVESEGVVDIFKVAGIRKADLSILDDQFLQTFKDKPLQNLRLMLLEKLIRDELKLQLKKNVAKAKSFREMLEATLQKYHNRLIDAAAVIKAMLLIRKDMNAENQRAAQLGLEPEEVAFYDAVADCAGTIYDQSFLSGLVHDVVRSIKGNLKVDWNAPHRDAVKADVRAAVKRVLARHNIRAEDFDLILARVMKQAEASFADWPAAA